MSIPHHCGWASSKHRPCRSGIKPSTPPLAGPGKDSVHHASVSIRGEGYKLVRVVHISDTHDKLHEMRHLVPDGDVLIMSGDVTNNGKHQEYQKFCRALRDLPHRVKLFTPGNHERGLERWTPQQIQAYLGDACEVLIDNVRVVGGLRVYGFPWGTMWGNTTWGYAQLAMIWSRSWARFQTISMSLLHTILPWAFLMQRTKAPSMALTAGLIQHRSVSCAEGVNISAEAIGA